MLARNYRVYASMNGIDVDDSVVEGDAGEEDDDDADMDMDDDAAGDGGEDEELGGMDVDDDAKDGGDDEDDDLPTFFKEKPYVPPPKTPSRRKKTKVDELVRTKVLRVLEQLDLAERRSRQCDETDFLRLLDAVRIVYGDFSFLFFCSILVFPPPSLASLVVEAHSNNQCR